MNEKRNLQMDGLRIMPVVNIELVYALSPLAEEIWHEHFDKIICKDQVDYMLEKFYHQRLS